MTMTEDVYMFLRTNPEDLFSYKELTSALNLKYLQVTRIIQTLNDRKLIYAFADPNSGTGRTRGRIKYFGISEELYAVTKKIRK